MNLLKHLRITAMGIALAVIVLLAGACQSSSGRASAEPMIWMYAVNEADSSYYDLYKQILRGDRELIARRVQRGSQAASRTGDQVLYLDNQDVLYLHDRKSGSAKIAESVWRYEFSPDESVIYYLTNEGGFYRKPIGGNREQLASDSVMFTLPDNGSSVYALDEAAQLYVWREDQDKRKIADNVAYFEPSRNGGIVVYLTRDDRLYAADAEGGKTRLSASEVDFFMLAGDGSAVAYLEDYNHDNMYGDLYISALNGEERTKVAPDITAYILHPNGQRIAYKKNGSLYFYEVDSRESDLAGSNAEIFDYEGDMLAYLTEDAALYQVQQGEKAELVASDVAWFTYSGSERLYYRTHDGRLYCRFPGQSESKLLAQAYQNFIVDASGLYLVTADDKLEVHTSAGQPQVLLEQVRDYSRIYNNSGWQVYRKTVRLSDIAGYWEQTDQAHLMEIKKLSDSRFSITHYEGSTAYTSEFEIGYTGETELDFAGESDEGTLILHHDGTLTVHTDTEERFVRTTKGKVEAVREAGEADSQAATSPVPMP